MGREAKTRLIGVHLARKSIYKPRLWRAMALGPSEAPWHIWGAVWGWRCGFSSFPGWQKHVNGRADHSSATEPRDDIDLLALYICRPHCRSNMYAVGSGAALSRCSSNWPHVKWSNPPARGAGDQLATLQRCPADRHQVSSSMVRFAFGSPFARGHDRGSWVGWKRAAHVTSSSWSWSASSIIEGLDSTCLLEVVLGVVELHAGKMRFPRLSPEPRL